MIRLSAAAALLVLTACGGEGGGEDFSIDVKQPVEVAMAEVGYVSPGMLSRIVGVPGASRSAPEEGLVVYSIAGSGDKMARIAMQFSSAGNNSTHIGVTVDTPTVRTIVGGKPMELSESKVEKQLQKALRDWAKARGEGESGAAGVSDVQTVLDSLAIAMNEDSQQLAETVRANPAMADQIASDFVAWNDDDDIEGEEAAYYDAEDEAADDFGGYDPDTADF